MNEKTIKQTNDSSVQPTNQPTNQPTIKRSIDRMIDRLNDDTHIHTQIRAHVYKCLIATATDANVRLVTTFCIHTADTCTTKHMRMCTKHKNLLPVSHIIAKSTPPSPLFPSLLSLSLPISHSRSLSLSLSLSLTHSFTVCNTLLALALAST
jgi:hypothetical protein